MLNLSPDIDFWSKFRIFEAINLKFELKEGISIHINKSKGHQNRLILRYKNDHFCNLKGCSSINYEQIFQKIELK